MGLPVFADLINPFVKLAIKNGQSDLAKRAIQNGRRAFREALGTPAKGSAKYDLMLMLNDHFTKLDELLKRKSTIH